MDHRELRARQYCRAIRLNEVMDFEDVDTQQPLCLSVGALPNAGSINFALMALPEEENNQQRVCAKADALTDDGLVRDLSRCGTGKVTLPLMAPTHPYSYAVFPGVTHAGPTASYRAVAYAGLQPAPSPPLQPEQIGAGAPPAPPAAAAVRRRVGRSDLVVRRRPRAVQPGVADGGGRARVPPPPRPLALRRLHRARRPPPPSTRRAPRSARPPPSPRPFPPLLSPLPPPASAPQKSANPLMRCLEDPSSLLMPMEVASYLLLATASFVLLCTLVRCCCRCLRAASRFHDEEEGADDDGASTEDDEPIVTPLPAGVKFHEPPEGGDDDDGAKDDDDLPAYTEVVDGASLANVERAARAAAAARE